MLIITTQIFTQLETQSTIAYHFYAEKKTEARQYQQKYYDCNSVLFPTFYILVPFPKEHGKHAILGWLSSNVSKEMPLSLLSN